MQFTTPSPGDIVAGISVALVALPNIRGLWEIAAHSPAQSFVAVGTLVATLLSSPRVERGVLIGTGLAIAIQLYRELTVIVDGRLDGATLTVLTHGVLWFATVSVGRAVDPGRRWTSGPNQLLPDDEALEH